MNFQENVLIKFPSGRYGFVGKVDARLGLARKDGRPLTQKDMEDARQFGLGPYGASHLKTRSFNSEKEAIDEARRLGVKVNFPIPAKKISNPRREESFNSQKPGHLACGHDAKNVYFSDRTVSGKRKHLTAFCSKCGMNLGPVRHNPYSPSAAFTHHRVKSPALFDRASFRTIPVGTHGDMLVVGCPKGHYKRGLCQVGMVVQSVLKPKLRRNPEFQPVAVHRPIIKSLHDAMMDCSAGDFHFVRTGPATRQELLAYFRKWHRPKAQVLKRNPSGSLDADAARELELFTENDGDLYRQSEQPIIKNLVKKKEKGTYQHALAVKLWRYHADRGAQKYAREYGDGQKWFEMFNTATRNKVAEDFADHFETEYNLGNYDNANFR